MRYLRVTFRVASSYGTPFLADTIFGHLCWAIALTEGDGALREFLNAFKEGPAPLLVSDGFPIVSRDGENTFYLPRPVLVPARGELGRIIEAFCPEPHSNRDSLRKMSSALKAIDKKQWISEAALLSLRGSLTHESFTSAFLKLEICPSSCALSSEVGCNEKDWTKCPGLGMQNGADSCKKPPAPETASIPVTHNVVNRMSGTAEDPFVSVEHFPFGLVHFLAKIDDNIVKQERFCAWLESAAIFGYGRDSSTGKGALKDIRVEPLDSPDTADFSSFLNLSSAYAPKEGELPEGSYDIHVKHGKLGGRFATSYSPWKKPILMIRAGAVFYAPPTGDYGQLVTNVHYQLPEVIQYGYAFPLGVNCNA